MPERNPELTMADSEGLLYKYPCNVLKQVKL